MNLKIQSAVMLLSFLAYLKFGFAINEELKKRLLDDGRLKVAECLQSYISSDSPDSIFKKDDWIEVFYRKFCYSQPDTKEGKRKKDFLEEENTETNVKKCLQEKNELPLFNYYKNEGEKNNSKNQEQPQHEGTFSEFINFIRGFCILPKTVKFEFDDPDCFLRLKVINCLKTCAIHLFGFMEKRIKDLSQSSITGGKEAEGVNSELVENEADNIKKLTKLGEEELTKYDKALEEAYNRNKNPEVKGRIIEDFHTYTTCAHFVCLMSKDDTPFFEWIEEEEMKMNMRIIVS